MRINKNVCTYCNFEKDLSDFYYIKSRGNYESQCKGCRLIKMKYQKRIEYEPKKERQRYLRRKKNGDFKDTTRKFAEKYPEKYKARNTLRNAVKAGTIKKEGCRVNEDCVGGVEAHHHDYSKPLDVIWLCRKHHKEHHYGKIVPPSPPTQALSDLQEKLKEK